jgi:hypothetical protein
MTDFASHVPGLTAPAIGCIAVTPSDGSDLASSIRAVTINVSGTVSYVGWDGVTYTTATLPAGTYSMLAKRIRATGTTATAITGWI